MMAAHRALAYRFILIVSPEGTKVGSEKKKEKAQTRQETPGSQDSESGVE